MSILQKLVLGMILYVTLLGIGLAKADRQVCFSVPSVCSGNCGNVENLKETVQDLVGIVSGLSARLDLISTNLPPSYYVNTCSVGLRDGRIADSEFSASTIFNHHHAAHQARLDYQQKSGSWSAAINAVGQWVQVDLGTPTRVTGVVTQGRFQVSQWITSFKIEYSDDGISFETVQNENGNDIIYRGNTDQSTYVLNRFPEPIIARFFRLVAETWFGHVSVRMEFITC